MGKAYLIAVYCLVFTINSQAQTLRPDEKGFLEYAKVETTENRVSISAIDFGIALTWYRLAKEWIYQDWFQDTIVSFLSKRTKQDDLEERVGELVLQRMKDDGQKIEFTIEELEQIIK